MPGTSPAPPEPPDGQDDEPDVRQAVLVVLLLLADVRQRIKGDPDNEDLVLRLGAVTAVLRRIRDRLGATP